MSQDNVEELPKVNLTKKDANGKFWGVADDFKIIGATKLSELSAETLKADYSPCPFGFKDLQRLVALIHGLEEYTADGNFEILVPTVKQGPLIVKSGTSDQCYLIAPRYTPYLSVDESKESDSK